MSADWKTASLASLCVDVSYGYTESAQHAPVGPKFLRITDIQNGVVNWPSVPYCTIDTHKLPNYLLRRGDIVIARTGNSTGENYVFDSSETAVFASYLIRYRIDEAKVNPFYVWYQLRTQKWWDFVAGSKTGSAQAGANAQVLGKFEIAIPSRKVQDRIVDQFKAIDSKIATNRRINQTLEAMAQAIFKSWFVDFEPVKAKIAAKQEGCDLLRAAMTAISGKSDAGLDALPPEQYAQLAATAALFPDEMEESELGEIPRGWEVKPLGDFLTIRRGGSPRPIQEFMAPSGLPWVKIADATAENSPFLFRTKEFIKESGLKKTVYLKSGSLILTNSATPGLPKFLQLDACIHDGWLYFPEKHLFTDQYLYFLFQKIKSELVAQGNGSVFTNLKTDILRGQRVLVPTREVIAAFTILAGSILENIKSLAKEGTCLATLRDTLLPKLLSGELSVTELDSNPSEVST